MIEIQALIDAVVSHALSLGVFEKVNGHEPKSAPGNGITGAVWVQSIQPILGGLNSTSVRFTLNFRCYTSMLTEPQDLIDPNLAGSADLLMEAVTGDFTLDGMVRSVDLLGAHGTALSAEAGYLEQDKRLFRVITVTIPLIVNDAYGQVA